MPSQLKITGVRGKVIPVEVEDLENFDIDSYDDCDWSVDKDLKDFVKPVKFVLSPFIKRSGNADMMAEFTFSNDSDFPIKIQQIDISLKKDQEISLDPAGSNYADYNYLPWEPKEESNWQTIYEDDKVIRNPKFISEKSILEEDKTFSYKLGSEDNGNNVITTPVSFEGSFQPEVSDGFCIYHLSDFKTLSNKEPILLPENITEASLSDELSNNYKKPDSINFWVEWKDTKLARHKNDAEFKLGFDFESKIGEVSHLYIYYNLPESGELMNSQSNPKVENFPQSEQRHIFREWKDRYKIRPSDSVDDFTLAEPHRVTRAKSKKQAEITTAARYEVSSLASIDSGLNSAMQSLLLLIATGTIGYFSDNPTIGRISIIILIISLVVVVSYWINVRNFNPITNIYLKIKE